MDLYLIRHAEAQPPGGDIPDDDSRPLTPAGHAQCQPLAAALRARGVRLDKVVSSPLLRARQTAEGLLQHGGAPAPELVLCDHLAPGGKRRRLTRFLQELGTNTAAVVGHMPDLGEYAAWLIGSRKAQLTLAKSGFALVQFDGRPDKRSGVLACLVTPEWYPAG